MNDAMVAMSLEAYSRLTDDTETALDLAERMAADESARMTHEDVFLSIKNKHGVCKDKRNELK